MTKLHHAAVAERAYELWLKDGMSHGKAEHHWMMAEKLLRAEAPVIAQPKAKKASSKSSPRSVKARSHSIALHS